MVASTFDMVFGNQPFPKTVDEAIEMGNKWINTITSNKDIAKQQFVDLLNYLETNDYIVEGPN